MATTISLDPAVRDRLRGFCGPNMSYSEGLGRLLDLVEAGQFFASFRRDMDDPKYPWIEQDDFQWD